MTPSEKGASQLIPQLQPEYLFPIATFQNRIQDVYWQSCPVMIRRTLGHEAAICIRRRAVATCFCSIQTHGSRSPKWRWNPTATSDYRIG